MKKLTALLLSLCLLAPAAVGAVPSYSDTMGSSYEKYVSFASAMGFMEGYPDGTFHADETMTRAEFAALAVRLRGIDAGNAEAQTPFPDVSTGHWASGVISCAVGSGILKGYPDGYFYPEEKITVGEAVCVVIGVLGYTYFAESQGGYPQGYLAQASSLGILRTAANAEDPMTRGMIAELIYRASEVDILRQVSFGQTAELEKKRDVTYLSEYHNIYKARGIVTADQYTKINGETTLQVGEAEVDGVIYDAGDSGVQAYLGQSVEFYYQKDDTADRNTILLATPRSNRVVEIKSTDLAPDTTNSRISYYDGGRRQHETIESNADVIYNLGYDGKAINLEAQMLLELHGTITGIDNDNDGGIDVLILTDWDTVVVEGVSTEDKRISLMFGAAPIELDDAGIRYSIRKNGQEINLGDISKKDMLSVAVSRNFYDSTADKKKIQILVCTDILSGSVTAISEEGITITSSKDQEGQAKEYRVSDRFISENGTEITNDFKGAFYLDTLGEVAYYEQGGSSGKRFGYVLESASDGGISTSYSVKMLTQTGSVEIYPLADRLSVDGTGHSAAEAYQIMLANTEMPGKVATMVRYGMNSDGKINFLDTKAPNSDHDIDELTESKIAFTSGMRYQSQSRMLVSYQDPQRYIIGNDCVVFVIPEVVGSDDEYMVYGSSYFSNEKYYGATSSGENFSMWNVKDGVPAAISMTVAAATAGMGSINTSDSAVGVVTKINKAASESGEQIYNISIRISGKETKYSYVEKSRIVRSDGSVTDQRPDGSGKMTPDRDLTFGDVVMLDVDAQSRINVVYRLSDFNPFDMTKDTAPQYQVKGMSGYTEWIFGSVRRRKDNSLAIDVNRGTDLLINSLQTPQICIVDKDSKTVTATDFDNIRASEDDAIADKVFVRVRFGSVREIFIYR